PATAIPYAPRTNARTSRRIAVGAPSGPRVTRPAPKPVITARPPAITTGAHQSRPSVAGSDSAATQNVTYPRSSPYGGGSRAQMPSAVRRRPTGTCQPYGVDAATRWVQPPRSACQNGVLAPIARAASTTATAASQSATVPPTATPP